jgi:molecular chaperone DnaK
VKEKIKPDQIEKANKSIQELKSAMSTNNLEEIKNKTQDLKNTIGEISSEAYRAASTTQTTAEKPGSSSSSESSATGPQGNVGNHDTRNPSNTT